ncbi:MAG: 50S ribosomal protein L32 [bacterium]|nr:50S ribosomal protein L32 [bacterium]
MAVPKKRRSKSKKRMKKACWKIVLPNLRPCPSCRVLSAPHMVCYQCGHYKDRLLVKPKLKKPKQKET